MIDDKKIALALQQFARERDWDQFHTPRNLASSISVESAELLEIFQWTGGQGGWADLLVPKTKAKAEEELADVLLYLIRFADLAGINLERVAAEKIERNRLKYPAQEFRGSDRKYNEES